MKNSNDNTSVFYDNIYKKLKGEDATSLEINLISKYLRFNSRVLDIGGGSGRHAIALANKNFKVDVIDSSKGMLDLLKKKVIEKNLKNNIRIYNKDIYRYDTKHKYDLILMFWNTFNEIALTKKDALKLLNKCNKLLNPDGKIIINIDNTNNIDPSKFNFTLNETDKNYNYNLLWKTSRYFKRTNTSISKEEIIVTNLSNQKDTKTYTSYIKQRYWSLNEIKELSITSKLNIYKDNIKNIGELYLVLSKVKK